MYLWWFKALDTIVVLSYTACQDPGSADWAPASSHEASYRQEEVRVMLKRKTDPETGEPMLTYRENRFIDGYIAAGGNATDISVASTSIGAVNSSYRQCQGRPASSPRPQRGLLSIVLSGALSFPGPQRGLLSVVLSAFAVFHRPSR